MENRRMLHDYSLVLIVLTVVNVFVFVATVISSLVNGSIAAIFADADATVIPIMYTAFALVLAIEVLFICAQIIIGIKGLRVAEKPTAQKGYIIAARVFFFLNIVGLMGALVSLFDVNNKNIIDTVLNVANIAIDLIAYEFFARYANGVRRDVIDAANAAQEIKLEDAE